PEPLGNHPLGLVALQGSEVKQAEAAEVRGLLEAALEQAGQPMDLPFLAWSDFPEPRDYLPRRFLSFCLGEADVRTLLFARNPLDTLAGLLHTRGLVGLSPYNTA